MSNLILPPQGIDYGSPINRSSPLTRGLVSWWSALPKYMGGSRFVDLCGRNHGTLTSMDPPSDWLPSSHQGGFGCLDFDGTNDYVATPVSTTLTAATFSFWIKPRTLTAYYGFMFSRSAAVSGIHVSSDGTKLGYIWNDAFNTYTWTGGPSLTTGEWQFCCVTISPTDAVAYVGSQSAWSSGTNAVSHTSSLIDSLRLGADSFSSRNADGLLDDFCLYNRALAADEVYKLYQDSRLSHPLMINRIRRTMPFGAAAGFKSAWARNSNYYMGAGAA